MKVFASVLLFGIFAYTHTFAYTPKLNPKGVNLALETVLEFNVNDKRGDIKILDKIQNVITEIRTIIDKHSDEKTHYNRAVTDETLTDFIIEVVDILNTYKDTAFEDFVRILNDEIGKYYYKGCKFSELTENHDILNLITTPLDSIIDESTYVKKRKINDLSDALKYENYDSNVKKIVDYINSLYAKADGKFRRVLSQLKGFGKSKSGNSVTDLVKIVKNGLQSIIFDHYTNLSKDTRRHLRQKIETFLKLYKKNDTQYNKKPNENLESDSIRYQIKTNNETPIRKIKLKTKQSENKNKITKTNNPKNERKQHNNQRQKTTDVPFENKEKKTSKNTEFENPQSNKFKLLRETGEGDNLSVSFNSLESHKDHQDNRRQFKSLVSDINTQKSINVTKKPEIINSLNVTTKTPANNTIPKNVLWIEQSTGRLPKAVLDKLAKTSESKPNFTDKKSHKYSPKYKKNKVQKKWHGRANKTEQTRRKGYEPKKAKTHKKKYDPQNHDTLRYLEQIRVKNNEKNKIYDQPGVKTKKTRRIRIYDKMQDKSYEMENDRLDINIYERSQESKQPFKHRFEFDYDSESDSEDYINYKYEKKLKPKKPTKKQKYTKHGKTQQKVFEHKYPKTHERIYEQVGDKKKKTRNISDTGYVKILGPVYELENDNAEEKIYDRKHESEIPTKHPIEFDSDSESKKEIKYKYVKNLKPNKPTNIKSYDTEYEKAQDKLFETGYEKTHEEINEPEQDSVVGNMLNEKHETTSAIKKQFKYESVEDVKHKPFETSKPRKLSAVKHNNRDLIGQHDVKTTKLFTEKHNEGGSHEGLLRVKLNLKHLPIKTMKSTIEANKTEQVKTIKFRARKPAATRKVPAHSRPLRLYLDNKARMKPSHYTSPLSNSSEAWSHVPLQPYYKNYKRGPSKHDRHTMQSKEYSSSFTEDITQENIEIMDDDRDNAETTSNATKRIKNPEGQLNESKNRVNVNAEKKRTLRHRFEVVNTRNEVQPEQIEAMYTLDAPLTQNTSKTAETANQTVLIDYVPDKDSAIKEYDVVRDVTKKTKFKPSVNIIPVEPEVNDKINITDVAVKETVSIEGHKDKYAEDNIEHGHEMITSNNMDGLNVTREAENETVFSIKHVVDKDSNNNGNRIEKAEQSRSKSNENNNFEVTQNKSKVAGTEVDKIESTTKHNYVKDSTNNDTENIFKKGKMSKTSFRSDQNMVHKYYKDMKEKNEVMGTVDTITNYKINNKYGKNSETNFISDTKITLNNFNNKTGQFNNTRIENEYNSKIEEDIVDKDHQIYRVDGQTSVIRNALKDTTRHENLPIRSTTEVLLQVLDVQVQTESGITNKNRARKTAATRKVPANSRPPKLHLDDKAHMKASHHTSPLNNSSKGFRFLVPLQSYSKNNKRRPSKYDRHTTKSTDYSSSPIEDTRGNVEIVGDDRHNAQTTSFSFLKDSYVNERIRNLERQLNESKSIVNAYTRGFGVMSNEVQTKQMETMSSLNTVRQNASNMAETVDHVKDALIGSVTDKDYDIDGFNIFPNDYKVKNGLTIVKTAGKKDKYAKNNKELSNLNLKSGLKMMDINRLNKTEAAINETDFSIEHVDIDSNNKTNRIDKAEKFKTKTKSKANNNFEFTRNKLKTTGTAVDEIEHNYIKDNDSSNIVTENVLKKHIMSKKTRFRSDLNVARRNLKDITDKTDATGTADIITKYVIKQINDKDSLIDTANVKSSDTNFISDTNMFPNNIKDKTNRTIIHPADIESKFIEEENNFKSKDDTVDNYHQIDLGNGQTSIIQETLKKKDQIEKKTKQQEIDDATFVAKDRVTEGPDGETYLNDNNEIKVIMKDQQDPDFLNNADNDDASKGTETPPQNTATTSSLMKNTESTTNATAILAETLCCATDSESTVVTSSPNDTKKVVLNESINDNKNKMADTSPAVDVISTSNVSQTYTEEVRSKVDTNVTNL